MPTALHLLGLPTGLAALLALSEPAHATPRIDALTPADGFAGLELRVDGAGLAGSDAPPQVLIGGRDAAVMAAAPERLRVRVPAGVDAGARTLVVVTGEGYAAAAIRVHAPPPQAARLSVPLDRAGSRHPAAIRLDAGNGARVLAGRLETATGASPAAWAGGAATVTLAVPADARGVAEATLHGAEFALDRPVHIDLLDRNGRRLATHRAYPEHLSATGIDGWRDVALDLARHFARTEPVVGLSLTLDETAADAMAERDLRLAFPAGMVPVRAGAMRHVWDADGAGFGTEPVAVTRGGGGLRLALAGRPHAGRRETLRLLVTALVVPGTPLPAHLSAAWDGGGRASLRLPAVWGQNAAEAPR